MNTVLKRLIDWKEVPPDTAVLCISYLQNYYFNEILRGFCEMGNYSLKNHFSYQLSIQDVSFPKNVYEPGVIIDKCQERIKLLLTSAKTDPVQKQDSEIHSNITGQANAGKVIVLNKQTVPTKHMTQYALVAAVIEENRIMHVPKMSAFLVSGNKDDKYAVTLFPKEICLCPATGHCYHILAAKMSIGKPIEGRKHTVN